MKNYEIAYLAGLFDGEGSFSIQVNVRKHAGRESAHFTPKMTMTLYRGHKVLNELVAAFGGKIYFYKCTEGDGTEARWSLHKRMELQKAATSLLPYLRIKKKIATRFLKALSYFPEERAAHRRGERSWDTKRTLKVAEIALSLNDYKKSPKTMAFLNRLRKIYTDDGLSVAYSTSRQGQRYDKPQTHCKRGHKWNQENTRINPKGYRECRSCNRQRYQDRKRTLALTI